MTSNSRSDTNRQRVNLHVRVKPSQTIIFDGPLHEIARSPISSVALWQRTSPGAARRRPWKRWRRHAPGVENMGKHIMELWRIIHSNWIFHYTPFILGYPLWKPPYDAWRNKGESPINKWMLLGTAVNTKTLQLIFIQIILLQFHSFRWLIPFLVG